MKALKFIVLVLLLYGLKVSTAADINNYSSVGFARNSLVVVKASSADKTQKSDKASLKNFQEEFNGNSPGNKFMMDRSSPLIASRACRDTLFLVSGEIRVITFLYETSTTVVFEDCNGIYAAKSEVRKRHIESITFANSEEQFYKGYYKKYPDIKKPKTSAQQLAIALLVLIGLGGLAIAGFYLWIITVF